MSTRDPDEESSFTNRLEAGAVSVQGMTGSHPQFRFGGTKISGIGSELYADGF